VHRALTFSCLESPVSRPESRRILLTIEYVLRFFLYASYSIYLHVHSLTASVLAESLAHSTALLIAYHPPLFKPVSRLTLDTPLHSALLKLACGGVSVYSPHSALDSVRGGINDWLVEGVVPVWIDGKAQVEGEADISYLDGPIREQDEGGKGRLVVLRNPVPIEKLVNRIKRYLGIAYGASSRMAPGSALCPADISMCAQMDSYTRIVWLIYSHRPSTYPHRSRPCPPAHPAPSPLSGYMCWIRRIRTCRCRC